MKNDLLFCHLLKHNLFKFFDGKTQSALNYKLIIVTIMAKDSHLDLVKETYM